MRGAVPEHPPGERPGRAPAAWAGLTRDGAGPRGGGRAPGGSRSLPEAPAAPAAPSASRQPHPGPPLPTGPLGMRRSSRDARRWRGGIRLGSALGASPRCCSPRGSGRALARLPGLLVMFPGLMACSTVCLQPGGAGKATGLVAGQSNHPWDGTGAWRSSGCCPELLPEHHHAAKQAGKETPGIFWGWITQIPAL